MRHPDPLIMSADIARVVAERPEMGEELVRALYQHLVLIEGRQPEIDELRDYVDRLSSLDERALRQRLGLVARRGRARSAATKRESRAPEGLRSADRGRGPGRRTRPSAPSTAARPTQEELASRLDVAVRTLQDFLKANDLGWPLED